MWYDFVMQSGIVQFIYRTGVSLVYMYVDELQLNYYKLLKHKMWALMEEFYWDFV